MWSEVLERFEQHAPVGVMARVALEQALPATWIDEVFEASRQRQYPRELMMSTVVELMMLVSLGLPPSLHAASKKRLAPLRGERGAAPPGHTLVVYDPDQALVTDIVACEDAHESERTVARTLVASAGAGELWLADSHFCTRALLQGWQQAGAAFIVREHGRHPRLVQQGPWQEAGRCETGVLKEQSIGIEAEGVAWRRIQLVLDEPTREGLTQLNLWSNLPPEVTAEQIAQLYRRRWRIEGLFGRIESVLNSEMRTLGHPRAALLGFATAVLAYNVLSLPKRSYVEAAAIRKHVSTARVLRSAKGVTP